MANGSPTLGFIASQRLGPEREPTPISAPAETVTPELEIPDRPRARPITDNPFSRIGLILGNVAAGMRGQELPTTKLKRLRLEQRRVDLQTLNAGLDAITKGAGLMKLAPASERPKIALQYGASIEDYLPGATKVLESLAQRDSAQVESILALAGEHGDMLLSATGGDPDDMLEFLSKNRDMLERHSDERNEAEVKTRLGVLRELAERSQGNPELQALFAGVQQKDGMPVLTAENIGEISARAVEAGMPAELGLTQGHLNSYRRNPQWGLSAGILTPEMTEESLRKEIFPELKGTNIREGGRNKIVYTDEAANVVKTVDVGQAQTDPATLKAALLQRSLGPELPEGSYSPDVVQAVNKLSPQEAGDKLIVREQQVPVDVKTTRKKEAQLVVDTKAKLSGDKGSLINSSQLLQRVAAAPMRSFGVVGTVSEWAAGWIGQANPGLADSMTKWATGGMSAGELKQLRTDLRAFIAQQITVVTGEESGRYTEAERQLTERVVAALEAGASQESVKSALTALTMLQDLAIRNDEYFIGVDTYDLLSKEAHPSGEGTVGDVNLRKYNEHLMGLGIDSDQDRSYMMRSLYLRQQELEAIRVGRQT